VPALIEAVIEAPAPAPAPTPKPSSFAPSRPAVTPAPAPSAVQNIFTSVSSVFSAQPSTAQLPASLPQAAGVRPVPSAGSGRRITVDARDEALRADPLPAARRPVVTLSPEVPGVASTYRAPAPSTLLPELFKMFETVNPIVSRAAQANMATTGQARIRRSMIQPPASDHTGWWVAGGGVALLALGLGAWMLLRKR
jgi:hypothetical protein